MEKKIKTNKMTMKGKVVSDKMKDTAVVCVERYAKHPKYKKYQIISKKYKAHNPNNTVKIGDIVFIEECRPISKDKRFRVIDSIIQENKNNLKDNLS